MWNKPVNDLLSQLRPDHPVLAEYTTEVFFICAIAALILLITVIIISYCFRYVMQYRKREEKIALWIDKVESAYTKNIDSVALIKNYNMIMKSIANQYYPQTSVASMSGAQWLNFLDKTGKTQDFSRGYGAILGMYYHAENLQQMHPEQLRSVVRQWIRRVIHV